MTSTLEQAQLSETLSRVRRIETRLLKFVAYFGIDPAQDFSTNTSVHVADGAMHCSSPEATIGALLLAARKADLTGSVPVYLLGRFVGNLQVTHP